MKSGKGQSLLIEQFERLSVISSRRKMKNFCSLLALLALYCSNLLCTIYLFIWNENTLLSILISELLIFLYTCLVLEVVLKSRSRFTTCRVFQRVRGIYILCVVLLFFLAPDFYMVSQFAYFSPLGLCLTLDYDLKPVDGWALVIYLFIYKIEDKVVDEFLSDEPRLVLPQYQAYNVTKSDPKVEQSTLKLGQSAAKPSGDQSIWTSPMFYRTNPE